MARHTSQPNSQHSGDPGEDVRESDPRAGGPEGAVREYSAEFEKIRVLSVTGHIEEAIELLLELNEGDRGNPQVLTELGHNLIARAYENEFDRASLWAAELALLQASELDPAQYGIWLRLSDVHYRLGHQDKALACLEKAVRLEPDDPEAEYRRGVVLSELGRDAEGVEAFRKAGEISMKIDPLATLAVASYRALLRTNPGDDASREAYEAARARLADAVDLDEVDRLSFWPE